MNAASLHSKRGIRVIALAAVGGSAFCSGAVGCGDDSEKSIADASVNDGDTGDASVVVTAGDAPITPEVAARFAVLVGTCSPSTKAESVLRHLYDNEGPRHRRSIAACAAAKANGCLALSQCGGETYVRNGGECPARCDGDTVERCDNGFLERFDCAQRGLKCLTNQEGALPTCSDPDAKTCVAAPGTTTCGSNGVTSECSFDNEREIRGVRCADLGMTCTAKGCQGMDGMCPMTTPSSSITFAGTTCTGTKVAGCENGGRVAFDCGRHIIGAARQTTDDAGLVGSAQCGIGTACVMSEIDNTRTCDGDSVVICNRGRIDRVDCRALGFTGCKVYESKAICVPGVE